ncbi:MAG: sensor histidine kinase [Solirubrobacteraceae bacterium]
MTSLAVATAGMLAILAPVILNVGAVSAPAARSALDATTTLVVLAAAVLLRAGLERSRRLRDLLLFGAALTAGLTRLLLLAVPAALEVAPSAALAAAQLWAGLLTGAGFAVAALAPRERLTTRVRRPAATALVAGLMAAGVAEVLGLLAAGQLVNVAAATGEITVRPLGAVVVLGATALTVLAAVGFFRGHVAQRGLDALLLSGAMLLLAGATWYRILPRPSALDDVALRDVLDVGAFGLILAMAVGQQLRLRERTTRAAALAERRAVARDLHDGIAQDLAFIAAHEAQIAAAMGDGHPLVVAAQRALALSRATISDLSDPRAASAREALEAVAHELEQRFGIAVVVHAQLDAEPAPEAREHLARIVREAIANAARHGGARNVLVCLAQTGLGTSLRVIDDGCGIGAGGGDPAPEGFGLRSMRERARTLGGHLAVRDHSRGGTELEVVLP